VEELKASGKLRFNFDDEFEFSGTNAEFVEKITRQAEGNVAEWMNGKMRFIIQKQSEGELEGLVSAAANLIESAQDTTTELSAEQSGDLKQVKRELDKALKALKKAEKAIAEEQTKKAASEQ